MPLGAAAWGTALLLWLAVVMVPGYLIASAVNSSTPVLERWATAPLVSIAITFAAATGADTVRRGTGLAAGGVALGVCALGAALVVIRREGARSLVSMRWTRTATALALVVTTSLLIDVAVVARSATSWGSVTPNDDGNSHGLFVERILLSGSVDPATVAASDLVGGAGGGFYPLGLHAVSALISLVTNVEAALTIVGFVAGSLWAPLAIVAWGRRFLDEAEAVAAAAVLALASPFFPWAQLSWGGWPLVVAISLVPAATAAVLRAGPGRRIVIPALAVCGLLAIHVTEVLVVILLAAGTLFTGPSQPEDRHRTAIWAAIAGALGGMALAPLAAQAATRASVQPADNIVFSFPVAIAELLAHPSVGVGTAAGLTLLPASVALFWWALVSVGTVRLWRRTLARGTLLVLWLFVGLSLTAFVGFAGRLTLPWYDNGYRLLAQAVALACLPMGVALVAAHRSAWRDSSRRTLPLAGAALGVVVVGASALRVVEAGSWAMASSVVTPDDRAAFAWLADRVAPNERVLNEPRDGSTWAYVDTAGRVSLVFGAKSGDWVTDPSWQRREYLLRHVTDINTDLLVRQEAQRWRVRYVIVGEQAMPGTHRYLDAAALEAVPGMKEVFRSGGARVFELPR
jgi:hypothetical protein